MMISLTKASLSLRNMKPDLLLLPSTVEKHPSHSREHILEQVNMRMDGEGNHVENRRLFVRGIISKRRFLDKG